MSVFTILGSGFGLYGYLPALIDGCSHQIILPERYRTRLYHRPELARFRDKIRWEKDEGSALEHADGGVIALPPEIQPAWIRSCMERANIKYLILEKPLGVSPEVALIVLSQLSNSSKAFRVGYTFRYTPWGNQILELMKTSHERLDSIMIHWSFAAHHFLHDINTWKRFTSTGGGAIRYYGIQMIALLAEIGYQDVTYSQSAGSALEEIESWSAAFLGPGLPKCDVFIDTKSQIRKFQIEIRFNRDSGTTEDLSLKLDDPFDDVHKIQSALDDRRVPILSQLCSSLGEEDENQYRWYYGSIQLWQKTEQMTGFSQID